MTTGTLDRVEILSTVLAHEAATGWLNAFLAAGSDEERPAINRTVALEWFDAGIQLICTDGTVLFRSWIAAVKSDDDDTASRAWPINAEAPVRSVVVMDVDGFAVAFMRTLLQAANELDEMTITTAATDDEANIALGADFMRERLTLRACGQRIDLAVYESPFPDWRRVRLGDDNAERVKGLTLAPRLLGLVGKLKGASRVDMEFYGDKQHVVFTARGDTETRGLIMPMRRQDVESDE